MKRRDFVVVGTTALLVPYAVIAQKKTPVIGLLWNDSVRPSPHVATLLAAMRDRGYVLDRDFRIEDQVTLEGYGGYAESVAKLMQANVDLIVVNGATATVAAAKATKEIPIVTIMGLDPVATGLAASLSRPGGNVTGLLNLQFDLTAKRMELLKQLVPGLSRVGIVLTTSVGNPVFRREAEAAARVLKIQTLFVEVAAPSDIEGRIAELVQQGAGAIYVTPSSMLVLYRDRVVSSIAKHGVPTLYGGDRYIEAGGLMALGSSQKKNFIRAAGHVDRILKGARAGELPIEQIAEMELVVNLKTAKAQGIKIPAAILLRADRVIE